MPPPVKARKEAPKKVKSARDRAVAHESGFGKALSVPEGTNFFAVKKAGTYRFDILPYTVGTGMKNKHAEPGDLYFEQTYFVHRAIGPDEEMVACPKRNFNQPCPICEHRAQLASDPDGDEQLIKDLSPKERQLWWVLDHAEKDKGPKLFDMSYFLFGKALDAKVKAGDEGEYDYFADPNEGYTLKVTFEEESFGSGSFRKVSDIEMKARKEPIDQDVLDQCGALDEMVREIPYDELKAMFLQEPVEEGAEEEEAAPAPKKPAGKPAAGKKPAAKPEPEETEEEPAEEEDPDAPAEDEETAEEVGITVGMTVDHPKIGRAKVVHVSPDGSALRLQDADGEVHRGVNPNKVTIVPEEEEETPAEDEVEEEVEEETAEEELDDPEPEDDPPLEEEEEVEEEPAPKPPAKKPAAAPAKPAGKPSAPSKPPVKPAAAPAKKPAGRK